MTVINSNTAALRAQNGSRIANQLLDTAEARLSSGKRINSASDDAAGLAISNAFTSQINGQNQAISNANDGISLAQTADGTLSEVTNNLQRLNELAVQAASGTYSSEDITNINAEVSQLTTQISSSLTSASFNGVSLFTTGAGAGVTTTIQTGANASDTVAITTPNLDDSDVAALDFTTSASANTAITTIQTFLSAVNTARANLGASESRLNSVVNNLTNNVVSLTDANSRISDADFSVETTNLAKAQILSQASTAILAQANQNGQGVLKLLQQ